MSKWSVCPYCFESIHKRDIDFRCVGKCERVEDAQLIEYGVPNNLALLPPVFSVPEPRSMMERVRPAPRRWTCDDCDVESWVRVCPVCHHRLPSEFGEVDAKLIAIVGDKSVGKSIYLTVAMHELLNQARPGLGLSATVDDDSDTYRDDYEARLYRSGSLLDPTRSAAGGRSSPLVFKFTQGNGDDRARRSGSVLSFYDPAGEDLQERDKLERYVRYIHTADALLLMVDVLQLSGVRDIVDPSVYSVPPLTNQMDVLSRSLDFLRSATGTRSTRRITLPVAVALTKFDAVADSLRDGSSIEVRTEYSDCYDPRQGTEAHEELTALLHEWGAGNVDSVLRDNLSDFRYFAVSALGGAPIPPRSIPSDGIHPIGVEDPLVWLFGKLGILKRCR